VSKQFCPLKSYFKCVVAHTDSPCFKLRPISKLNAKEGLQQVGIAKYGGGLWHTWLDRELKLAGRIIIEQNNKIEHRLCHIDKACMFIPNLCIHLQSAEERQSFKLNYESHLKPIISTKQDKLEEYTEDIYKYHYDFLLDEISNNIDCSPIKIKDFELNLVDAIPSQIVGIKDEFILSGRIDNQLSCWATTEALIKFSSSDIDD